MIIALKRSLLLLIATGLCSLALAGRVDDLYQAREAVPEQSDEALRSAAAAALERVLVRVSGQSQLPEVSGLESALASPAPLLTRYRYQRDGLGDDSQLWLDMSFSPRQVNALLQSAGLPVWSANRPTVLLWMVADTAQGRQFVGSGAYPELELVLQKQVKRRGLALQLPLFDLVDAGNLSAQALWQMREDQVREASQRYGAPFILMGRASQLSSGQWLASWVLLDDNSGLRFDTQGEQDGGFIAEAVDRVADLQASRYAVNSDTSGGRTLIHVQGIKDFDDYAQLVTYLESLAVVEHANTAWAHGQEFVIELVLKDDMEKVQRYLQLDGRLSRASERFANSRAPLAAQAYYSWLGQ